jgi:hypothetical protein
MIKILAALAICFLFVAASNAEVKVVGNGSDIKIDTTDFPLKMKAACELMHVKCVRCHSLERIVTAVNTGIAPTSHGAFDKNTIKDYVIKMLLMPGSNISREDAKNIVELLHFLRYEVPPPSKL